MYHQILKLGDDAVPCVIEYTEDETGPFVIESIQIVGGQKIPVGIFDFDVIEEIAYRLARGHDRVIAELDAEYRIDRAIEREDDYNHPLGI